MNPALASPKNHYSSIDMLRGLASLAVCFVHLVGGVPNFVDPNSTLSRLAEYGPLGVDVFFLISGFVIPLSLFKYRYNISQFFRFMAKRITRIDPPYLISALLMLLSMYLTSLSPMARGVYTFDKTAIVLHIGYLAELFGKHWLNPVFWTLAIEFQFYLLMGLLFPLLMRNKWWFYLSITLFASSFYWTCLCFEYFIHTRTIFKYTLHFALGIALFSFSIKQIEKTGFILLSIVLLGLIYKEFGPTHFVVLLLSVPLILFTDIDFPITRFLGKVSYSLYLIHALVGVKILSMSTLFFDKPETRVLLIWVTFCISLFVAYLYYKWVEKPFLILSRKLDLKQPSKI